LFVLMLRLAGVRRQPQTSGALAQMEPAKHGCAPVFSINFAQAGHLAAHAVPQQPPMRLMIASTPLTDPFRFDTNGSRRKDGRQFRTVNVHGSKNDE